MGLSAVTGELDKQYKAWKSGERKKDNQRKEFFALALKELENGPLARQVIEIQKHWDATEYVTQWYPRWRVINTQPKDDVLQVLIEEDPQYKEFVYINPDSKRVFKKQVDDVSPVFDDERFVKENPDVWEDVSYVPDRQLKPLDQLTEEQIDLVSQYFIYLKKPTIKLAPPRNATEDDLDD